MKYNYLPIIAATLSICGSAMAQPDEEKREPTNSEDGQTTLRESTDADISQAGESIDKDAVEEERTKEDNIPSVKEGISFSIGLDDTKAEDKSAKPVSVPRVTHEYTYVRTPTRVIAAATGSMLRGGEMSFAANIDTAGGISGDLRLGLGDVAEFGADIDSFALYRRCGSCESELLQQPTAYFKMGVHEDRFFNGMPAASIIYRKSFERNPDSNKMRYAELSVALSKHYGVAGIHLSASMFDGRIEGEGELFELNQQKLSSRIKPALGITIRPYDDTYLMFDLSWQPDYIGIIGGKNIELRPMVAWGVRYLASDWFQIESGVRLPNASNVNLLDAQIFGGIRVITGRFSKWEKRRH